MGRKLLVADDSVTIQKVIKLALSSEGYEIVAISSGADAVNAIKNESPDLVLIDVSLPIASAYDVKREVNTQPDLKDVKFVLMYSAFEKVDERMADSLVFHGRLIKPFDPSNLRKVVADLLKGKKAEAAPVVTPPQVAEAPPPPPVVEEVPTEEPSLSLSGDDLPPLQDQHPIVEEPVSEPMSSPSISFDEELPVITPRSERVITKSIEVKLPNRERTKFTEVYQPASAPVAPEVPAPSRGSDIDIKNLTDSTIQMTGLDEWSVDESRKMKAPDQGQREPTGFVEMPSLSLDDGGSSFLSHGLNEPDLQVPKPTPLGAAGAAAARAAGGMTPPTQQQNRSNMRAPNMGTGANAARPAAASQPKSSSTPVAGSGLSRAELETVLRQELQNILPQTLERVVREILPGIAVDVIKREIDRVLDES